MQNGEQKSRLMQVGREMFGNLKAFSVLILLLIAFSLLNGNFVRTNNLITILQQSSHVAILAYAETLVIIDGRWPVWSVEWISGRQGKAGSIHCDTGNAKYCPGRCLCCD